MKDDINVLKIGKTALMKPPLCVMCFRFSENLSCLLSTISTCRLYRFKVAICLLDKPRWFVAKLKQATSKTLIWVLFIVCKKFLRWRALKKSRTLQKSRTSSINLSIICYLLHFFMKTLRCLFSILVCKVK